MIVQPLLGFGGKEVQTCNEFVLSVLFAWMVSIAFVGGGRGGLRAVAPRN